MSFKIIDTGGNGGFILRNTNGSGLFTITQNFITEQTQSSSPSYTTSSLVLNLDAYEYIGTGDWMDLTNNSNDATGVLTPTYQTLQSGSFYLSGGGIIETDNVESFSILDNPTLDNMSAISIEMWIKIDSVRGIESANMLFSKRDNNANGYVGFFTTSGYIFRIGTSSPTQLFWSTTPVTGSWQQIMITVGSSGGKVYRNGVEVQDSPLYVGNFGNINTAASLLIGDVNPYNSGLYGFSGNISIFRIYNRILSLSEIQQNYNSIKDRYVFIPVTIP
jgi:hypothetical protein